MVVATTTKVGQLSRTTDFDGFYRLQRPALYRALALALSDADLAAEAVDEGMVRAYQRWRRIRDYDNPAGWVYRVGLNWGISHARRGRRSVPVATVRDDSVVAAVDPPDPDLVAAIAALPPQQRAVVVARFHLDWSIEQIATALNVPAGTVKSRLHRGLATLRSAMEENRRGL